MNIISKIDWKKGGGLVPAIIQDAETAAVLMLGYMNQESLAKTFKTKKVWFYSRSKKRLWMKGEVSGNILSIAGNFLDCDGDALLIKVKPNGPTCHTGERSCFGKNSLANNALAQLYSTIKQRKAARPAGSYTSSLFEEGLFKICTKLAEESGEVIKAATKESNRRLIEESADLIYHLFVLLAQKDINLSDLSMELEARRKPPLD